MNGRVQNILKKISAGYLEYEYDIASREKITQKPKIRKKFKKPYHPGKRGTGLTRRKVR